MRTVPFFSFLLALSLSCVLHQYATASTTDDSPEESIRPVLNREYLPTVLEMLASAQISVRIIQYEYVSHGAVRDIEQAILAAARRGVDVKMLVDDTVKQSRRNVEWLAKRGIDVKLDETAEYGEPGDKTTHAKLILIDDRKVLIGSTNFSAKSIEANNEANVYLAGDSAGQAVRTYFDRLWADPVKEPGVEMCRLGNADIWFNRHYFPNALKLFQGARKRIYVIVYGMNVGPPGSKVRDLLAELARAKKRGVDVRVMLDASEGKFAEKNMEFNDEAVRFIESAGVPAKFDSTGIVSHAKILLVDDIAVVGGTNWGRGPLELYNDCNVAVRRMEAVRRFSEAFLSLWSGRPAF